MKRPISTLLTLAIALAVPSPAPARRMFKNATKLSLIAIHVTHDPSLGTYDDIVPSIVDGALALAPELKFLSPAQWSRQLSEQHTATFVERCGGNLETCSASSFLARLGVSHVLRVSIRPGPKPGVARVAATLFTVGFHQRHRQKSVLAPLDRDRVVQAAGDAIAALLHGRRTRTVLPVPGDATVPPSWVRRICWVEELETGPVAFAVGAGTADEPARAHALDRLGLCLPTSEAQAVEFIDAWSKPNGTIYRLARWQPMNRPPGPRPEWKSWAKVPEITLGLVDPVARDVKSMVVEALRSRGAKPVVIIHGAQLAATQLRAVIISMGGKVNAGSEAEFWIAVRERNTLPDIARVRGKASSEHSRKEAIARAVTAAFEQLDDNLFPSGWSPFAAAWAPTAAGFEQRRLVVAKIDIKALDLREGARKPPWLGKEDTAERVWADGSTRFAVGRARGKTNQIGPAVRAAFGHATDLLEHPGPEAEVIFLDFCLRGLDAYVLVGAQTQSR